MNAIITVGLGFGDEGKGSCVDYLVREHNADLVVRYNGGCQAAHNVVLPDGTHHCFHQFGSGSLIEGVKTYIGSNVIVDPVALEVEREQLNKKIKNDAAELLYMNVNCLVTTPWHQFLNKGKEIKRGADKHGSCGFGIGEVRRKWLEGDESLIWGELLGNGSYIYKKLNTIKQQTIHEGQKLGLDPDILRMMYMLCPRRMAAKYQKIANQYNACWKMIDYNTAIFEGAQGILLDEHYGFHPYTTWSTTTSKHALEELNGVRPDAVIGITRAYHTRHGAGPFPTYNKKLSLSGEHNKTNEFQDDFKFGCLDLPLLEYAVNCDPNIDSIFLTCCDHPKKDRVFYNNKYKGDIDLVPSISLRRTEQYTQQLMMMDSQLLDYKSASFNELTSIIEHRLKLNIDYMSFGNTYKDKVSKLQWMKTFGNNHAVARENV